MRRPPKTTKISVGYLRVSSEKQGRDNKVSISEQRAACERLAGEDGQVISAWLVDKDRYRSSESGRVVQPSGTRLDRPGFVQLLADMRAGVVGRVYAWAQDRIVRGTKATGAFSEAVEASKTVVRLVYGAWDADTADIMGAIGGYELRKMRQRMQMGRDGRIKSGLHVGPTPRGYEIVRDSEGHSTNYKVKPVYRKFFAEVGRLFVAGLPYEEIRRRVTDPETGAYIHPMGIRYLIRNEFYRGKIHYAGRLWVSGKHEAAWDSATVSAIERELGRRDKLGASLPRRRKYIHLFSGVLRCAYCDRPMSAMGGDRKPSYYCHTTYEYRRKIQYALDNRAYHPPNHIRESKLLAQVGEILQEIRYRPAMAHDMAAALAQVSAKDVSALACELEAASGRLAELRSGLESVRSVPAAARALAEEITRVERTVADIRGELEKPLTGVNSSELVDGLLSLAGEWERVAKRPRAELRQRIFETIPALWVMGGRITVPDPTR